MAVIVMYFVFFSFLEFLDCVCVHFMYLLCKRSFGGGGSGGGDSCTCVWVRGVGIW